jgi:uncharacterized protein YdhG (YjbR/CyaY superfamily)
MVKTIPLNTVDGYIASFPPAVREQLEKLRALIRKTAPKAEEVISYKMPAYKLDGMLVYFAGYEKHIGFYPMPSAIAAFRKELAVYKSAKGSVQFPVDKPLPVKLITAMIRFRVQENLAKAKAKTKK